jgi:hypothetical protein
MKKHPRWAAALVVLTVILTSTLAPLEGAAGPIQLQDDPKYFLGDPDGPTGPMTVVLILPGGSAYLVSVPRGSAASGLVRTCVTGIHRDSRDD